MRKVYLISSRINGCTYYKIGYTKRKVETRIKEFKTGNCSYFDIVKVYEPDNYCVSIERKLHQHFMSKKIDGEWFDLTQEDINEFESICEKYYKMFETVDKYNTYNDEYNIDIK